MVAPAPKASSAFARWSLALAALCVGLALGELVLRIADLPSSGPFLQEFYGERFKLMAYDSNPSGALDLDLSDAKLRSRLAARLANPTELEANWQETPWAVSFDFDAQGFRERPLAPKRPGTFRIAVVGDSFTVGHGLPNDLAYPRLLEVRLQRRFDHAAGSDPLARSVEVLNLGRGDVDLPGILRTARYALEQLEPDVVVYGYFMNDPIPTVDVASPTVTHDMLDAGWVEIEQSPTRLRIGQSSLGPLRILDLLRRFAADRRVTAATIERYRLQHEAAAWKPTLDRIAAMAKATRGRGARFVLLLLPLPYEIADSPFAAAHRQMKASAAGAGIEVVDALPALAVHADDDLRLHPRDRHPSPLYTRVVAELLADVVGRESSPR